MGRGSRVNTHPSSPKLLSSLPSDLESPDHEAAAGLSVLRRAGPRADESGQKDPAARFDGHRPDVEPDPHRKRELGHAVGTERHVAPPVGKQSGHFQPRALLVAHDDFSGGLDERRSEPREQLPTVGAEAALTPAVGTQSIEHRSWLATGVGAFVSAGTDDHTAISRKTECHPVGAFGGPAHAVSTTERSVQLAGFGQAHHRGRTHFGDRMPATTGVVRGLRARDEHRTTVRIDRTGHHPDERSAGPRRQEGADIRSDESPAVAKTRVERAVDTEPDDDGRELGWASFPGVGFRRTKESTFITEHHDPPLAVDGGHARVEEAPFDPFGRRFGADRQFTSGPETQVERARPGADGRSFPRPRRRGRRIRPARCRDRCQRFLQEPRSGRARLPRLRIPDRAIPELPQRRRRYLEQRQAGPPRPAPELHTIPRNPAIEPIGRFS